MELIWVLGFLGWLSILIYHAASKSVTLIGIVIYLLIAASNLHPTIEQITLMSITSLLVLLGLRVLRRQWLTKVLFRRIQDQVLSTSKNFSLLLSQPTAKWLQELMLGMPNWSTLLHEPLPTLTNQELDFLNQTVHQLIQVIHPWDLTYQRHDLPTKIWQQLKHQGFLGLRIPTEFGGRGFSDYAIMAILQKLAAVSEVVAQIVNLANSLNPGHLVMTHGTEYQRQYYLPRIARGEAVTCLGLLNAEMELDITLAHDYGMICLGQFRGDEVLGLKLQWQKHLVSLAPVATDIAVLVKIYDPQNYLNRGTELGLSWVLLPTHLAGITIGRWHTALAQGIPSGPCVGQDVFVPLDYIIGGSDQIGHGWQMLELALQTYQGLTLPACQLGRSKAMTAYTAAYACLQYQQHPSLGGFGRIAEKLANITSLTYLVNTIAWFSLTQPKSGTSAITKYQTTELARQIVTESMEVQASKAYSLGPHNVIAQAYQMIPENIHDVESNDWLRTNKILATALNGHPYFMGIWQSIQLSDLKQGLKYFDGCLSRQLWCFASHHIRAVCLSLTRGRLHWHAPSYCKRQFQQLARLSSAFALVLDTNLLIFNSHLMQRETIRGQLADCLSKLYGLSAILQHYNALDRPSADIVLLEMVCQKLVYDTEQSLLAVIRNLPSYFWRVWLRWMIFPFGLMAQLNTTSFIQGLSELITSPNNETRNRLLEGLGFEDLEGHPLHAMHQTWQRFVAIEPLLKRMYQTLLAANRYTGQFESDLQTAKELSALTDTEIEILRAVEHERREVLRIDDFTFSELNRQTPYRAGNWHK